MSGVKEMLECSANRTGLPSLDARYQTLQVLSRGQWERTILAIDTAQPAQPYCIIKEFHSVANSSEIGRSIQARLDYEVQLLTALGDHPSVATLWDCTVAEQDAYLVREFVIGESVLSEDVESPIWTGNQVAAFLLDVLQTLHFVHGKAGIHGNLHPGNVIQRGGSDRYVLTDFSTIAPLKNLLTESQVADYVPRKVDKLGYFATEQIWGKPRPSSDLYSLGVICIERLTGLKPWQMSVNSRTGELVWRDRADIDSELSSILERMVRQQFSDRYASASQVLRSLYGYLQMTDQDM